MPIYDYKCRNCGYIFEDFVKIEDRDIHAGETCGKCLADNSIYRPIQPAMVANKSLETIKTTDAFNDRLIEIKKTSGRGNTINARRSMI